MTNNQFYKLNPKVDDIPDTYSKVCNGVKLLVLGTVDTARQRLCLPGACDAETDHQSSGSASSNDVVILDMEAGLEHLGRGTTEGMDAVCRCNRAGRTQCTDLQECQTSGLRILE